MNTYANLVNEYNEKIAEIVADKSLTKAECFNRQIALKFSYEEPIAKAFLAEIFA